MADQSHGTVTLTEQQAQAIIDIVLGTPRENRAFANMYLYNANCNSYEFVRTVYTDDRTVNAFVKIAIQKPPIEFRVRYECYNSRKELQGNIFTEDRLLFD